ncbi:MAG: NifB/NifX family molybdenum-iron cluster-binding protein [Deltaproteobacteria bacterium]|nr:NifB/NifX family molybdenum-iron cluster-binding protein [Deltaproteobacteria bacterium]
MKIVVPTNTNQGKEAPLCDHFGSASFFTVYDTDKDVFEVIANGDEQHEHGQCQPLSAIANRGINVILCRGMGVRALQKLGQAGIRAFVTHAEDVEGALNDFKNKKVTEMNISDCCTGHSECHS